MKNFICCLFIVGFFLACNQVNKSPIEGAWELISWERYRGDSLVWQFPVNITGSDIVIFSEGHLLSIGRFKRDTTFIDNYVGAKYTLEGTHLEETLIYFPNQDRVGQTVKQILEIRNDTLIKSYPCDNDWKLNESDYSIEKYVRLN